MLRIRPRRTHLLAPTLDGGLSIAGPVVLCTAVALVLALSSCVSPPNLVAAGSTIITEMIPSPAAPPSEPIPTPLAPSSEPIAPDAPEPPVTWAPVPAVLPPLRAAWPPPYAWRPSAGWIESRAAPEIFVSPFHRDYDLDDRLQRRSRHELNDPPRLILRPSPTRGMPHAFGTVLRPLP